MKTLILVSGGLDSTCALVKLIRETNDELIVHHIYYKTLENRAEAEYQAIFKIIPYCQKIRTFTYHETMQDYTQIFMPYDPHIMRFTAAQICRGNSGINRCVSGHCKEDTNPNTVSNAIFNAALSGNPDKIEWYYPCGDMTKYDEKEYLTKYDPELLDHIWYCRKPIKNKNKWDKCNKCYTCYQMENIHLSYILK